MTEAQFEILATVISIVLTFLAIWLTSDKENKKRYKVGIAVFSALLVFMAAMFVVWCRYDYRVFEHPVEREELQLVDYSLKELTLEGDQPRSYLVTFIEDGKQVAAKVSRVEESYDTEAHLEFRHYEYEKWERDSLVFLYPSM